jgi:P-aminobenzoate N-oxygenase AurF
MIDLKLQKEVLESPTVDEFAVPEEDCVSDAARHDSYFGLIHRLNHQSVVKHFDAYADIEWETAESRIDPDDSRWELEGDDVLGATEWYRSQPAGIRSRIGLHIL